MVAHDELDRRITIVGEGPWQVGEGRIIGRWHRISNEATGIQVVWRTPCMWGQK